MWRKKRDAARAAWEAAMKAAGDCASGLEAKGDAVTSEEKAALDGLIEAAKAAKGEYDRILPMARLEEEQEAEAKTIAAAAAVEEKRKAEETESAGRKTRDVREDLSGAPGIRRKTTGKDSAPLMVSNIFRACRASGGAANRGSLETFAPEELDFSNRMKRAGYEEEMFGSMLFPLGDEFILEPVDDQGRKQADFSELRAEIKARLPIQADPGEIGWLLKRFPGFAKDDLGIDRKDMQIGADDLGGILIPPTQAGRVIDLLRARSVLVRAGAQEVPLPPSGNISYPRLTSDPAFTYTDPDTTSDLSTSSPGTGVVRLSAKSLRGAVTIPNDLLRYSSPSVEMVVRSALAAKAAVAEDNQMIEGVGSSVAPKGIINHTNSAAETPTTGSITLHIASTTAANGDTFSPEDVMEVLALFWSGLDPDPPTAWIMRPLLWAAICNRRADAVVAGDGKGPFMFPIDRGSNNEKVPTALGGFPVYPTTQASANRTKGASSVLAYSLFGNFRRLLIGRSGAIELAVSEHVKFLQDKTVLRAILRSDSGLEHEESFVFVDDLLES